MNICLVNMPFVGLHRPSIALGLLQELLLRDRLETCTHYANLWFAEVIGLERHEFVQSIAFPGHALGEWIFSRSAFPELHSDDDGYLESLIAENRVLQSEDPSALKDGLQELRTLAESFITQAALHVLDDQPRIVGCTSMFQQHTASLALLREIRKQAPEVVTLMGGANCETVMGRTTHQHFDWVDFVVSGEADELIVPLCQTILSAGRDAAEFPEGVFAPRHRQIGYPLVDGGDGLPRSITRCLAESPPPNYDDYFATLAQSTLRSAIKPGLLIETSRGCWWGAKQHCTFCGLNGNGMQYRSKSAGQVLSELATQTARYGIDGYDVVDNILDMSYFRTLFPELHAADRPYRLFYEVKSNLTREQVRGLRAAGVEHIQPGIESLHSQVLSLMKKGCQAWQNVQLLKWCAEFGIRAYWNFLFDFPGEQDQWYAETADLLPLLRHLQPPENGSLAGVVFHRYSPYHTRAADFGLQLVPLASYGYVYPLPEAGIRDLAYCFEDTGPYSADRSPPGELAEHRYGAHAVQDQLQEWHAEFWSQRRAALTIRYQGDRACLEDSRPIADEEQYLLEGIELDVYIASEGGLPRTTILRELKDTRGYSQLEVAAAIDQLLDRKLLVHLDERLVGLAVRLPQPQLPAETDHPGGRVDCGSDGNTCVESWTR